MIENIDLTQYAIISDFDGTISTQDSNDMLFKILGNTENERIEHLYKTGSIGTREGFQQHFEALELSEDEYSEFILNYIKIDSYFKKFYKKANEMEIPFFVVSGGFRNAISLLLKREGIEDLTVYANELITINNRLTVKFAYDNENCKSEFGVCGNCKVRLLKTFRAMNKKIIFIGDGLTDRCAAEQADIVFAKNELAEYCTSNGVNYILYDSFKDIYGFLFA